MLNSYEFLFIVIYYKVLSILSDGHLTCRVLYLSVWELSLFLCSSLLPQMSQPCTLPFFLLYINVIVGFFARFKQKRECFPDAWKSSLFFHLKANLGWSVPYPAEHVFSNGFWETDFTNRCSKYLFIPPLLTLKQWVRKWSFSVYSVMKL